MSNAIFPSLPGLAWGIQKRALWATARSDSSSGRQYTLGKRLYPLWAFRLPFEVLRQSTAYPELATLLGFFNARRGSYDDFLYKDPQDCTASGQSIGTGDGATKSFQLVRNFGSFVEPVGGVDTASAVVQVAGVNTAVTFDASLSIVTFAAAPANGAALTWSGTFYFRCRFLKDELAIDQIMAGLNAAKAVEFQTFRP
jgi:uncharacterized protein (TIGR02217 family)